MSSFFSFFLFLFCFLGFWGLERQACPRVTKAVVSRDFFSNEMEERTWHVVHLCLVYPGDLFSIFLYRTVTHL